MKLNLEVKGKHFKQTTLFYILYMVLGAVRVFFAVAVLFIPTILCLFIFPLLGVKGVINKIIDLYEGLTFLGHKP